MSKTTKRITQIFSSLLSESPFEKFVFSFFLLFSIVLFLFLIYSQREAGLSWDEAFYYHPSIQAVEWLQHVFRLNIPEILDVDRYFGDIPELPPLGKIVIGVSYRLGRFLGFEHLLAMRWLNYFFFLLQIAAISFYLRRYLRPFHKTWWLVPLIFAGFPRILGHAHFATVDLLSSLFILLSTIFFLEYIQKGGRVYWLFIAASVLGIIVKFNNLVHFCLLMGLLVAWERKKFLKKALKTVVLFPFAILLLWPWLWNDPLAKFVWFWNFFFHHAQTSVVYMGNHYAFTRAPWHYPFGMFVVTTPLLYLIILIFGLIPFALFCRKKQFFRKAYIPFYVTGFCALYPLLLFLAPNAPTYDGVRLFIPAFPFITMIICLIVGWCCWFLEKTFSKPQGYWLIVASILFLVNISVIAWGWKPYFLSYYNVLTGGLDGAHQRFEVTYWCEPFNRDVISYLNNEIEPVETVRFLAIQSLIPQMYEEWGYLEPIDYTSDPPYDYHVLYNRQGFFGSMERHLYNNELPVKVFSFRDVPFVMIYHTDGRY